MKLIELIQRVSYRLKLDRRFRYYDRYKRHLSISREEMIDKQNKYIQSLVRHAYNNTSFYKTLFVDNDINPDNIKSKDDLRLLPPLTKSIIRKNLNKISSTDAFGKKLIEITSGGTTGEQGLIYASPYYIENSAAFTLRSNFLAGWNPGDKWIALRMVMKSSTVSQTMTSYLRNKLNRMYPLNALEYNDNYFEEWVKNIKKIKPKIIYGYSSVLLAFSRYILANNIYLPSIQIPVSTSEVLYERDIIEKAFRAKVVNQYGSREILAIGLQVQNADSMIIFDDNVVVNYSDKNELLVTALHSYGFPLINYKIGDKGSKIEEKNNKINGLPFSRMNLDLGRVTDNFITKDNKVISATSIMVDLTRFKLGVKEHQILQYDYNSFVVNYIPDIEFNTEYRRIIEEVFMKHFGLGVTADFNVVKHIPLEKSGKKLMYKRAFNP